MSTTPGPEMKSALEEYFAIWSSDAKGQIDLKQVAQVVRKMAAKSGTEPDANALKAAGAKDTLVNRDQAVSFMMSALPKELASLPDADAARRVREQTAKVRQFMAADSKGAKGKGAKASATKKAGPKVEEPKSFARRDHLIDIERKIQAMWEAKKANQPQSKPGKSGKYMCTFPYPYMNGKLHLGHAFTICKAEFAARFQRLLGKRVLFPFGFHCTGMPIAACAEKLQAEVKQFGNPPQFPADEPPKKAKEAAPAGGGKKGGKKKKGKAAKKKSKKKYQWQIMEEMGVPRDQVAKFQDARYWLKYFPPIAIEDLKKLGVMVDWRRSFITTDANPYYDAFVRWQFNRLRAAEKVHLAKRVCVFSPSNGQPCADHDRAEGEGVPPQEYTLIKIKVIEPLPEVLAKAKGDAKGEVFLAAATLRPETMYGQTNCWLLPDGEYSLAQMNNGDIFVCSRRAALNMSFQELCGEPNQPKIIGSVKGKDLMGIPIRAPLCAYDRVYTMPLMTISMGKGTGVVTSVPSDAPADYAAWVDLKKDKKLRAKYGITEEMLEMDIVPIIDTPLDGASAADRKLPAPYLCKKLKIKSQKAVDKLEKAKKECYKISNAKGVMIVGEAKGKPVMEAKEIIKAMMKSNGQAVTYHEPQERVVARAGNEECVCALTEQWFLKYGEASWRKGVEAHIKDTLDCYNPKAQTMFEDTIAWLRQWACSRTAGLGTRLPWDKEYLIESLSDSTIYMAYYTIAHFVQGGGLDGGDVKAAAAAGGIRPEDLTDEVFNFIFADPKTEPSVPESKIPAETLRAMRAEFCFWYPMDLRVSGKDLIRNHLTMSLYNHAAIWDKNPDMWPRSFFTNGHVMINSEKMSKSTGNFMTLEDGFKSFGSDACRLALADAGDGLEDSNFSAVTADRTILRLTTLEEYIDEMSKDQSLRTGGDQTFYDRVFDNEINAKTAIAKKAFNEMRFRDGLGAGFYEMLAARDWYRAYSPDKPRKDLVQKFVRTLMVTIAPICPHFAEYIWGKYATFLGVSGLVIDAAWPDYAPSDEKLDGQVQYLRASSSRVRSTLSKPAKKKKGKKQEAPSGPPNKLTLYYTTQLPEWKVIVLRNLKESAESKGTPMDNKTLSGQIRGQAAFKNKRVLKNAITYANAVREDYGKRGAAAFNTTLPFDEAQTLREYSTILTKGTSLKTVEIAEATEDQQLAEPGKPVIQFSRTST